MGKKEQSLYTAPPPDPDCFCYYFCGCASPFIDLISDALSREMRRRGRKGMMRTMLLVRRWLKLIFCGGGGTVFLEEGNSTISVTTICTSGSTYKNLMFFFHALLGGEGGGHKSGDFPFSSPPSPSPPSNGETDVSGRTFLKPGHGRSLLLPKATDGRGEGATEGRCIPPRRERRKRARAGGKEVYENAMGLRNPIQ